MIPKVLNLGFSATTTATVASLFVPIKIRLIGLNVAGYYDGVTNADVAYFYVSLSSTAPLFTAFPHGVTQGGILAHLRMTTLNGTSGNTFRSGFNEWVNMPGVEIEAGAYLYIHTITSLDGNMLGVTFFHVLEG